MYLKPAGNRGILREIKVIETSAGNVRLAVIEYEKACAQQPVYVVQGEQYYFYVITTRQLVAEKKHSLFCDLIEIEFKRNGYHKMKLFVRNYVLSSMGVYAGRV